MPVRVFLPLAAAFLGSAYVLTLLTDGVTTMIGFLILGGVFVVVHFMLSRR
jgi:hypothetical protein